MSKTNTEIGTRTCDAFQEKEKEQKIKMITPLPL